MGKGDQKSAKGKRFAGSYGNTRKRKKAAPIATPVAKEPVVKAAKKPAAKKTSAKAAK